MGQRPEWMRFFFKTMSGPQSYAGDGRAQPLPDFPRYKGWDVAEDPFRLIDGYTVLPDGASAGFTIIWESGVVRMQMNYAGAYPKQFTPFLRKILRETYQEERFFGFRGPRERVFHGEKQEMYKYHNVGIKDSFFDTFKGEISQAAPGMSFCMGREWISTYDGYAPLGLHTYHYVAHGPMWVT